MYFDYVGFKDNRLYGIINLNCNEQGINDDTRNIKILKFWGTSEKISIKFERSDYWKITDAIERREKEGYRGLTSNLISQYELLSKPIHDKLSKKYLWEKLKI